MSLTRASNWSSAVTTALSSQSALPGTAVAEHWLNSELVLLAPTLTEAARAQLAAAGVGAEIYYPLPLHMQQCFAYLGHKPEDFPESLRASLESLALPIYPELEQSQLQDVVDTIAACLNK